jgi:hypothetical protein
MTEDTGYKRDRKHLRAVDSAKLLLKVDRFSAPVLHLHRSEGQEVSE